jgi:hypothetical protein
LLVENNSIENVYPIKLASEVIIESSFPDKLTVKSLFTEPPRSLETSPRLKMEIQASKSPFKL